MDETPGPLARAHAWLQATPAEVAGLVILLLGSLVASGVLLLQAGQRPAAGEDRTGADPDAAAGIGAPVTSADADDVDAHVDGHDGHHGHDGLDGLDGHGTGDIAPIPLVVHVTGAVARPGVVTLDAGARVADAVAAAGGATDGALVEHLNLARLLQDGEHVHLPREGEDPPPVAAAPPGAADAGAGGAASEPIDLNRATAEQLTSLPGIGPAKAQAVIRHREEHGPFRAPGDLRQVPGIGEKTFQGLADLVTVS
ncbi:ComEA family DNA-binding protein [Egicoccus sp. AB-alg6-2]|uniref:ComEA family DNA-binding protein n=1 Tax=Egicoccus sp. AB-alg6-2 TaxID=3242692 RepID=UPI00359D5B6C